MNNAQGIIELAKENNGVVTTALVVSNGFSRGSLKYLVDCGKLERASRGVYTLPGVWDDAFVNLQSRYKRGIFALETALYLFELTDRMPSRFRMIFPSTYNLSGPKGNGVICSSLKEPLYSKGVVDVETPSGNKVKVYCVERTLCDILNPRYQVDQQIVTEAYKSYTLKRGMNIPLLSQYARELNVEERLRAYLEVLL